MNSFLESVRDMLVGRTIVGVEEYSVPSEEATDEVAEEGLVLLLDNGKQVVVGVDYEDIDLLVRQEDLY